MGAAALLGVEADRKHPTYDLNVLFLASVISQCLCESVAMAVAVVCVHELSGVHALSTVRRLCDGKLRMRSTRRG